VESEPLWNKVSDAQLKAMLAKHGIRHDTTVIFYGRDVYAAARVAQIMLYAGVKDVRLLDGGWKTWSDAGLPVERGMPPKQKPAPDFGAPIPGQPQLMLDTEQARACCTVRTPRWSASVRGRSLSAPPAATAISSRRARLPAPAGAMPEATPPTWKTSITRTAPCAAPTISPPCGNSGIFCRTSRSLYCGTGWRASETFMYARAMGWNNVSVYDGGWYEWSSNPKTRSRAGSAARKAVVTPAYRREHPSRAPRRAGAPPLTTVAP
jgi:thiosulfate/3-mercaptopyruvate sulfurtransferase